MLRHPEGYGIGVRLQSSPVSLYAAGGRRAGQVEHFDVPREAGQTERAGGCGGDPLRKPLEAHRRDQHLTLAGGVAQPRRHVDSRADVVVAFEQQGVAAGDPGAHRERRTDVGGALAEIEREGDGVGLVDGDDHAAVTEPLGDADAALGRDLAHDRPKGAEQPSGGVVAERAGVVGEPGEVDEHERAGDTHALQTRGAATVDGLESPISTGCWRLPSSAAIRAWRD